MFCNMRHTGIVGWRCPKPNRKYFVRIIILNHSHPCLCLIMGQDIPVSVDFLQFLLFHYRICGQIL